MAQITIPTEDIELVGGPAAGVRVKWSGGSTLEIAPTPSTTISDDSAVPSMPPKNYIYRRSLNNRERFVYQP